MPSLNDLVEIIKFPNETLSIEHKSWLNLSENANRAKLAKAAIALANHGGGIIVFGMRPDNANGGALESRQRPAGLNRYSQDEVNSAINRFADPNFHCELMFATHPSTNVEHAFVIVPSTLGVPVMTSRDCEGVITKWRCYIRKPNPRSEEPQTGEEWRALFEKCLRAGRESMLDAIRGIVQGHTGAVPGPDAVDALLEFTNSATSRWKALIAPLPANDVARMPHGRYEFSFQILDAQPLANLTALRDAMTEAGRVRHTGWGAFVSLGFPPFQPRPVDDAIENWLGVQREEDWGMRTPSHCDYWLANRHGRLVTIRGFDEDGTNRYAPGAVFDVTLPIWRLGEALLYVARLSQHFEGGTDIFVRCQYFGLQGRRLGSIDRSRMIIRNPVCHESQVTLASAATADQINDNLAEILHLMLTPLYERFNFYELPVDLVRREVEALKRGRF